MTYEHRIDSDRSPYAVKLDDLSLDAWDEARLDDAQRGLCGCGCGQRTKPIHKNNTARGDRKGEPRKFINGHHQKLKRNHYQVDRESGCWVWQGALTAHGYGQIRRAELGRRQMLAHVWHYELYRGAVPEGLELDHLCRNRACVNPDHLEAVTHAENMRRSPLRTRLTPTDVREIRQSELPIGLLAEQFGIAKPTVSNIRAGVTWKDIDREEERAQAQRRGSEPGQADGYAPPASSPGAPAVTPALGVRSTDNTQGEQHGDA